MCPSMLTFLGRVRISNLPPILILTLEVALTVRFIGRPTMVGKMRLVSISTIDLLKSMVLPSANSIRMSRKVLVPFVLKSLDDTKANSFPKILRKAVTSGVLRSSLFTFELNRR